MIKTMHRSAKITMIDNKQLQGCGACYFPINKSKICYLKYQNCTKPSVIYVFVWLCAILHSMITDEMKDQQNQTEEQQLQY